MLIPFHASERATLGVEMELALVDREDGELVSGASAILSALAAPCGCRNASEGQARAVREHDRDHHRHLRDVGEARADLGGTLAEVTAEADRFGLALICVGQPPVFELARPEGEPQRPLPRARARDAVDGRTPARSSASTSTSACASAEKAIAIANALVTYLPHLLALSASSPYWDSARDTGLASCRTKVFEALPTAGLPYRIADWAEFETFMETLVTAGRSSRSARCGGTSVRTPTSARSSCACATASRRCARSWRSPRSRRVSSRRSTRASTPARRLLHRANGSCARTSGSRRVTASRPS